MNHVAIIFEHIDFLNGLDGLDVEFLERALQFLIICTGCFVDFADHASRSTFSSVILQLLALVCRCKEARSLGIGCAERGGGGGGA